MNTGLRTTGSAVVMALWLGAALLMAASVAPAAFAVLPSRAMAGNVVGRVLPVIFATGIAAGLVSAFMVWPSSRPRAALAGVTAACCGIAQFVIGPRIARLREAIGPSLEALAQDDPQRLAFGKLHAISVAWMGAGVVAAAAFLIISLLALRQRS
jgi:hypothetical protein